MDQATGLPYNWRDCRLFSWCRDTVDPAYPGSIRCQSPEMKLLRVICVLEEYTQLGYSGNIRKIADIDSLPATLKKRFT